MSKPNKSRRKKTNSKANNSRERYVDTNSNSNNYGSSNDPSWYAENPTLLHNVANLPFPYATGSKFELLNDNLVNQDNELLSNSVPGIAAYYLVPTFGGKSEGPSALNMAANNFYSYVRHMNSGASNYDAPDLMIYIAAMDSIFSYHAFLQRLYGILNNFSSVNYYTPQHLCYVMGIDYSDVKMHIPDLRAYINMFAAKANTLKVPANINLFKRHYWMYSNIYLDEDSEKGQMSLYVPDGFYQYHETIGEEEPLLGNLTYRKWFRWNASDSDERPGDLATFDDIVAFGDQLLEVNRVSEDHNIMSGDINKAFGTNTYNLDMMADDWTVKPVVDMEVAMQMHNATVIGKPVTNTGVIQNPETGYLDNDIYVTFNSGVSTFGPIMGHRMLDLVINDPTANDVITATRLMNVINSVTQSEDNKQLLHFSKAATEIVSEAQFVEFAYRESEGTTDRANNVAQIEYQTDLGSSNTISKVQWGRTAMMQSIVSKFRYAPIFWIGQSNIWYNVFDINNMTVVHKSELNKMHEVALLSLLGIHTLR